jgi:hypothetical protein
VAEQNKYYHVLVSYLFIITLVSSDTPKLFSVDTISSFERNFTPLSSVRTLNS